MKEGKTKTDLTVGEVEEQRIREYGEKGWATKSDEMVKLAKKYIADHDLEDSILTGTNLVEMGLKVEAHLKELRGGAGDYLDRKWEQQQKEQKHQLESMKGAKKHPHFEEFH